MVPYTDSFKWALQEPMARYVTESISKFIPDKDLFENILLENPVPMNIKEVPKLDPFLSPLLNSTEERIDMSLEKLQQKTINVLGPLIKVWDCLDRANNAPEGEINISLLDLIDDVEKTILLLGQANNAVAYQRRLFVFNSISKDARKAKTQLKEKANMLETDNVHLFGKEFQNFITETAKSRLKSQEIRKVLTDEKERPFRSGPPFNNNKRNGGGRNINFVKSGAQFSSRSQGSGKRNIHKAFFNMVPDILLEEEFCQVHHVVKKNIFKKDSKGKLSRKAEVFSGCMESSNPRPSNIRSCSGLQNTFPNNSKSTLSSTSTSAEGSRNTARTRGNRVHVEERGYPESFTQGKRIHQQSFPCIQKGWRKQTSDKPETFKQFYPISTFQNGGTPSDTGYAAKGGLHVQNRLKRCIFYDSYKSGIQEISTVPMARECLRVSVLVFRARTSPIIIHQINENTSCFSKTVKCEVNNIPGRHVDICSLKGGANSKSRHTDLPSATSGNDNQCKEIISVPKSEHSVLRPSGRFCTDDTISPTGQTGKHFISMQKLAEPKVCNIVGSNKINRSPVINSTSCITSTFTTQVFTVSVNSSIEKKLLVSTGNTFEPEVSGRTAVVDRKSETVQWEKSSPSLSGHVYDNRCIQKGFGGLLPRPENWGPLVSEGAKSRHSNFGAKSSETFDFNIYKGKETKLNTHSNGQYLSPLLPRENGRDSEQGYVRLSQGNLGLSHATQDHNYCRVPSKQIKCNSRLGISKCPGSQRVEVIPKGISDDLQKMGNPRYGPVCISTVTSGSGVHGLETRPWEQGYRCPSTKLETFVPIRFPSFQSHRPGFSKSQGRKSAINPGHTIVTSPTMVCNSIANVSERPTPAPSAKRFVNESIRSCSFPSDKPIPSTSGVDGFREHLASEGISKQAAELISGCRRAGTISSYESAWHNWSSWCSKRTTDPFRCSLNYVLDYLADLFTQDYEYRTINVHRSSISAYHEQ